MTFGGGEEETEEYTKKRKRREERQVCSNQLELLHSEPAFIQGSCELMTSSLKSFGRGTLSPNQREQDAKLRWVVFIAVKVFSNILWMYNKGYTNF